jgi:hypothetical protein
MRRALYLLAAAAPVLAGCGGVPAAVLSGLGAAASVYSVADKVIAAADSSITTACAEYEKSKAAAVVGTGLVATAASAKVSAIESFGDAACAQPPSGDPLATAIWLGQLAGQITTLTSPAQ